MQPERRTAVGALAARPSRRSWPRQRSTSCSGAAPGAAPSTTGAIDLTPKVNRRRGATPTATGAPGARARPGRHHTMTPVIAGIVIGASLGPAAAEVKNWRPPQLDPPYELSSRLASQQEDTNGQVHRTRRSRNELHFRRRRAERQTAPDERGGDQRPGSDRVREARARPSASMLRGVYAERLALRAAIPPT